MKFYALVPKDAFGAAITEEADWRTHLFGESPRDTWDPRPESYEGSRWPDILWNDVGWALFSSRAQTILAPFCVPEAVQWLPVTVVGKDGPREYLALSIHGSRAKWHPDSYEGGIVVGNVLDASTCKGLHVFTVSTTNVIVVDQPARAALDANKLLGFKYLEYPAR